MEGASCRRISTSEVIAIEDAPSEKIKKVSKFRNLGAPPRHASATATAAAAGFRIVRSQTSALGKHTLEFVYLALNEFTYKNRAGVIKASVIKAIQNPFDSSKTWKDVVQAVAAC
jgi:hypothetical protein